LGVEFYGAPACRPAEVELQRGVELCDDAAATESVVLGVLPGEDRRAGIPFSASLALPSAYVGGVAGKWASHVLGLLVGVLEVLVLRLRVRQKVTSTYLFVFTFDLRKRDTKIGVRSSTI
jgi:hypothetical protein